MAAESPFEDERKTKKLEENEEKKRGKLKSLKGFSQHNRSSFVFSNLRTAELQVQLLLCAFASSTRLGGNSLDISIKTQAKSP